MVTELNSSNFDAFVGSHSVALIDFYATWCGPCVMMAPVIEQTATQFAGRVAVGKIDVDKNKDLTTRFGISAMPTFIFLKDGEVVETVCGVIPAPSIERQLNALLA